MNRELFHKELSDLDAAFAALKPELELTVRDPELGVEGYVVVWTTLTSIGGPLGRCGKGGTRITPQISLDEVKMLARTMALKNAAAGLPLGGAKSGLRADPNSPDFEKKYRRFVSMVRPVLCENGGIFGGFGFDIGGKPEHVAIVCDELKSFRSFTGKPVELGGTDYDREGIAGLGVAVAALKALELKGERPSDCSAAVQGLGAMGAAVVRYFTEGGGRIAFISDPRLGGSYELPATIPSELLHSISRMDFVKTQELLTTLACRKFSLDQILFQKVEVLFPCAVQDVITTKNVNQIQSRYVVEGANGPSSAEAKTSLFNRGVLLIPDFIANPGGIIAAFVELNSKISPEENVRTRKNVEDAKSFTRSKIAENIENVLATADRYSVEVVEAGRHLALKNIFKKK